MNFTDIPTNDLGIAIFRITWITCVSDMELELTGTLG